MQLLQELTATRRLWSHYEKDEIMLWNNMLHSNYYCAKKLLIDCHAEKLLSTVSFQG